nr:hypothetical protein Hi04_10k_c5016_00007 [uncultured bacterium]
MSKSPQRLQVALALFVLLYGVSVDYLSKSAHADEACGDSNSMPSSLKEDSIDWTQRLSQETRNAIDAIRPSLVTIGPPSPAQSVSDLTPFRPEFSDSLYSPFNGAQNLAQILPSATGSSLGGTGVIVSENGLIWTSSDVVGDLSSVTVTLQTDTSYEGNVVLCDRESGLAIVKIDAEQLPSVLLEKPATLKPADWAIAVALDADHEPVIAAGLVSSVSRGSSESPIGAKTVRFAFPISTDFAGCAFVNLKGELVGINVPRQSSSCVALPTRSAMAIQRKTLENSATTSPLFNDPISTVSVKLDFGKEGRLSSRQATHQTVSVPRLEWTSATIASSLRNWLESWRDLLVPRVHPGPHASEPR